MILFCLDCLATGRADIDKHYRSELLYLQVVIGSFEREMVVFAFEALLFEGRGERCCEASGPPSGSTNL